MVLATCGKSDTIPAIFSPPSTPTPTPTTDGWTNAKEAAAGTNPFEANPPDGYIQPALEHHAAVFITGESGPEIVTPEAYTLTWPSLIGKQYTLLFSPDLAAGSWLPIGPPVTATGTEALAGIPITQPDGSVPPAIFWRVAVSDTDADEDTLTDHEEAQLGTDPFQPDSDGDGTPDSADADTYNGNALGLDSSGGGATGGDPSTPLQPLYMNFVRKYYHEFCITYPPDETETTTYSGSKNRQSDTINGPVINDPVGYDTNLNTALPSITSGLSGIDYPSFEAFQTERLPHAFNCADHGFGPDAFFYYSDFDDGNFSIASGEAASSRLRLERLQSEDSCRTMTYLKLHQKYSWSNTLTDIDYFQLKIPANQLRSNEVETMTDDNDTLCRLARFSINDNRPATGVDNISNTVEDLPGSGYQEFPWIMAPCGGTIIQGGVTFPMSNDMNINIGNSIAGPMEITCPDATATPAVTSWITGEDLIHASWKGTGNTSGEKIPVFKFGTGADQISAVLPVRVKVMKKRTVKVGVYPVTQYGAGDTVPLPDNAALTYHLNQVFASQVNAWMEVEYQPQVHIQFGGNNNSLAATEGESDEEDAIVAQIEARADAQNFNIIIIMIHDINYGAFDHTVNPPAYNRALGHTITKKTAIVTTGTVNIATLPSAGVIRTTAHEIGHIMTRAQGHPNAKQAAEQGPAPLKGTDRTQRLMCSGGERVPDAKLLVKTEWDKIEEWLKAEETAGRIKP